MLIIGLWIILDKKKTILQFCVPQISEVVIVHKTEMKDKKEEVAIHLGKFVAKGESNLCQKRLFVIVLLFGRKMSTKLPQVADFQESKGLVYQQQGREKTNCCQSC